MNETYGILKRLIVLAILILAIVIVVGFIFFNPLRSNESKDESEKSIISFSDGSSVGKRAKKIPKEEIPDRIIYDEELNTVPFSVAQVEVPNFVGKDINEVRNDEYYNENFNFDFSYQYSSTDEPDIIINQSEQAGESVDQGYTIKLVVSRGKETITFPTSGITGEEYEQVYKTLTKIGFRVQKSEKENINNRTPGTVAGFSLEPGEIYDKDTLVYLFVWGEP